MSFNLLASAASSVARFGSPIDPIAHESPASIGHSLDAVALNPQPLPPRESLLGALTHRFDDVALNPQPLPPHEGGLSSLLSRFDAVALNPQPLPPREALSLADRIGIVADEFCGTVPHRLHRVPPPPPPVLDAASQR